MPWLPSFVIEGGMYGGKYCPAGTLTNLCNITPNRYEASGNGFFFGARNNQEQDYKKWNDAYGMTDDLLKSYLNGHKDGEFYNFDIVEIVSENPDGAQFYKQSLVFEAKVLARENVEPASSSEQEDLHTLYYEIITLTISRREYPTPYSPYIDTVLLSNGLGINGSYYIRGTKDLGGFWTYLTSRLLISLGDFTLNGNKYFGLAYYDEKYRADNVDVTEWSSGGCGVSYERLNEEFGKFTPDEKEDPNDDDEDDDPGPGHGGSGGGNGEHVLPDYPITIPPKPTIGPCSVSWLTTYLMSVQDLNEFGQELVNPDPIQKLKQFFTDPLDAIVGITLCPAVAGPRVSKTPTIPGTVPYTWSRSFMALLNQYAIVNCGYVDIAPYWDSCFDFDPYTRFTLFLPFIGYRDINADEIMGTKVGVEYHVDCVTGDCTAYVTKSAPSESMYGPMPEQIIAQFNGNCGVSVPIGRVNKDAAMQASFSLLAGAIGMGVGGAAAAAGLVDSSDLSEGQLASQVTHSTMTAVNAMKTKVERAGALSGNAGYLGYTKPYFIRKLARQSRPDNYKEIMGYPCNKPGPLRNYRGTGLAVVEDIQLNNIPAFGDELAEIISLLKGGVLV